MEKGEETYVELLLALALMGEMLVLEVHLWLIRVGTRLCMIWNETRWLTSTFWF